MDTVLGNGRNGRDPRADPLADARLRIGFSEPSSRHPTLRSRLRSPRMTGFENQRSLCVFEGRILQEEIVDLGSDAVVTRYLPFTTLSLSLSLSSRQVCPPPSPFSAREEGSDLWAADLV